MSNTMSSGTSPRCSLSNGRRPSRNGSTSRKGQDKSDGIPYETVGRRRPQAHAAAILGELGSERLRRCAAAKRLGVPTDPGGGKRLRRAGRRGLHEKRRGGDRGESRGGAARPGPPAPP